MRFALTLVLVLGCSGKSVEIDAGPDAAPDTSMAMCSYRSTRTEADRNCMQSSECVVVLRQLSCCQEVYEGARADVETRLKNEQTALTANCATCGCNAQPIDDLGQKGMTFKATCDQGKCTSHASF